MHHPSLVSSPPFHCSPVLCPARPLCFPVGLARHPQVAEMGTSISSLLWPCLEVHRLDLSAHNPLTKYKETCEISSLSGFWAMLQNWFRNRWYFTTCIRSISLNKHRNMLNKSIINQFVLLCRHFVALFSTFIYINVSWSYGYIKIMQFFYSSPSLTSDLSPCSQGSQWYWGFGQIRWRYLVITVIKHVHPQTAWPEKKVQLSEVSRLLKVRLNRNKNRRKLLN